MRQSTVVSNISLEKQEHQNPIKILICTDLNFNITIGGSMNQVNRNNSIKHTNVLY